MAEVEWTDELKKQVIADYESREPTEENSLEIVKDIANEIGKTPNGVRMILSRAGVYVKKSPAAATSSSKSGNNGSSKRVNKAEAIDALKKTIQNVGQEIDDDILDRLTGKAAVYLNEVINAIK